MKPAAGGSGTGEESTRVVIAALIGNVLVSATKYVAAFLSGSSALLTEAVHSTTDTANQLILLLGNRRSREHSDDTHNFGYGLEIYYWTFVVAMLVLVGGGVFSMYNGWRRIVRPHELESVTLGLVVLALSAVFEGASFLVGYRQYRQILAAKRVSPSAVSLWRFIMLTKDPNLYETLLEDGAALIGLGFAAAGLIASSWFGVRWADGAASIAIGLLLIADALVMLRATQSLMGGETVTPVVRQEMQQAIDSSCVSIKVPNFKTLHLGPNVVLVSIVIDPAPHLTAQQIREDLRRVREVLKGIDERVRYVMVDIR